MRLITVDRPGYGRSDPLPGRTLLGWADDVEQLLDHLGIERCAVVGVSAGAPHALACGARLPARVSRLGSVSGLGPIFGVPGLWDQLDAEWRALLESAAEDRFIALDEARRRSQWFVDQPESLADPEQLPEVDHWLARDPSAREALLTFVREAARQGVDGYAWDRLAFTLPWGFSLEKIEVETWVWVGEQDSIVEQAEFDLVCRQLPNAHCVVYPGEGHLLRGHWGEIFDALIGR